MKLSSKSDSRKKTFSDTQRRLAHNAHTKQQWEPHLQTDTSQGNSFHLWSHPRALCHCWVTPSLLFHLRNRVSSMPKARTPRAAMTPLSQAPVTKLVYLSGTRTARLLVTARRLKTEFCLSTNTKQAWKREP